MEFVSFLLIFLFMTLLAVVYEVYSKPEERSEQIVINVSADLPSKMLMKPSSEAEW